MVGLVELQARVASAYARRGLPSWPGPHPGVAQPAEEEYSRLTDPGRYQVVHERGRAWAEVLGDLPGVEAEELPAAPIRATAVAGRFDRGVRLTADRTGTLPLLLLERGAGQQGHDQVPVLLISVARPEVVVQAQPDFGCDACDSGSQELLNAIDEAIGWVVGGPFVTIRGRTWESRWAPARSRLSGRRRRPSLDRAAKLSRRVAAGDPGALRPSSAAPGSTERTGSGP